MKRLKKALAVICVLLAVALVPAIQVYAGSCHNADCGCRDYGINSCYVGMTCWYNDGDGCSGHSWYLYESTSATCTSGGRVVYKCSICPGERVFTTLPLGHDWGPWTCVNSRQHMRTCRRCGLTQYENHSMTGWSSHGDGNYSRYCPTCGYSQSKGLFISVSTTNWTLYRVNCITGATSVVGSWGHGGSTGSTSDSYTQTGEGIYYFYAISTDTQGHSIQATSGRVYLDHSDPVIIGAENTETDWTNIAPVISVRSTDYLYGTSTVGSGVRSLTIYDDEGNAVRTGGSSTAYTLEAKYEGEHIWKIEAVDNVGHVTDVYITTRYDITPPGIDGTEITFVTKEGKVISGYCQDNIIDQHIDDEIVRSENGANKSSGIKSVILYKVTGDKKEVIYMDTTYHMFDYPDTHSYFDVYYDINLTDDMVDYYILITEDFAGNRTKKKLTSQRTLLTLFHTSIDRGAY